MTWLSVQLWFLLLVAFVAGAVVTYLVIKRLVPDADKLKTHTESPTGGEH